MSLSVFDAVQISGLCRMRLRLCSRYVLSYGTKYPAQAFFPVTSRVVTQCQCSFILVPHSTGVIHERLCWLSVEDALVLLSLNSKNKTLVAPLSADSIGCRNITVA